MSTANLPLEMALTDFQARTPREDGCREELIEGELVVSPDPKADHAYIAEMIREALRPLLEKGYFITNNGSCVLPPRSMPSPDLFVIRRERMMEAVRRGDWIRGAPDLVVETNSATNRRLQARLNCTSVTVRSRSGPFIQAACCCCLNRRRSAGGARRRSHRVRRGHVGRARSVHHLTGPTTLLS